MRTEGKEGKGARGKEERKERGGKREGEVRKESGGGGARGKEGERGKR